MVSSISLILNLGIMQLIVCTRPGDPDAIDDFYFGTLGIYDLTIQIFGGDLPGLIPEEDRNLFNYAPDKFDTICATLATNTTIRFVTITIFEGFLPEEYISAAPNNTILREIQEKIFLVNSTIMSLTITSIHDGTLAILGPTLQRENILNLTIDRLLSVSDTDSVAINLHCRDRPLNHLEMQLCDIGVMAFVRHFTSVAKFPKEVFFSNDESLNRASPPIISLCGWRLICSLLREKHCNIQELCILSWGSLIPDSNVLMELLCLSLAKNNVLCILSAPQILFSDTARKMLGDTLCNEDNIASTYKSNHVLYEFNSFDHPLPICNAAQWQDDTDPDKVELCLRWNFEAIDNGIQFAIVRKIIYAHFGSSLSEEELRSLPPQIQVHVSNFFERALRAGVNEHDVDLNRLDYYYRVLSQLLF